MASLPFVGIKHRRPMTGTQMIIVASAAAFFLFLLWASIAQVDEVEVLGDRLGAVQETLQNRTHDVDHLLAVGAVDAGVLCCHVPASSARG